MMWLIVFIFFTSMHAEEYLYPVASCEREGQQYIYLFYQKSVEHVELWEWNPHSKIAHKALLSSFTPAALRILPDSSGFSFIDNGRIKIKRFKENNVKAIDVYEPLYDINCIEWGSRDGCYFSAKRNNNNAIYGLALDGSIIQIVGSDDRDYLYPQILNNELFFIERSEVHDRTTRYIYEIKSIDMHKRGFSHTILRWGCSGHEAIAFLHMKSATEGFFIEHSSQIDKQDKTISFSYYRFKKVGSIFESFRLFTFEIPTELLTSNALRLYESILPLLPRYYNNDVIYFINCAHSNDNTLSLYAHHRDGTITEQARTEHHLFSPLFVNNTLFCGGILNKENPPCMNINAQGDMIIELLKRAQYNN